MDLEQLKARHKRNAETINALNRGLSLKKFLDNILPNDMLESLFEKELIKQKREEIIIYVKIIQIMDVITFLGINLKKEKKQDYSKF